jgi:hypothetical protein
MHVGAHDPPETVGVAAALEAVEGVVVCCSAVVCAGATWLT